MRISPTRTKIQVRALTETDATPPPCGAGVGSSNLGEETHISFDGGPDQEPRGGPYAPCRKRWSRLAVLGAVLIVVVERAPRSKDTIVAGSQLLCLVFGQRKAQVCDPRVSAHYADTRWGRLPALGDEIAIQGSLRLFHLRRTARTPGMALRGTPSAISLRGRRRPGRTVLLASLGQPSSPHAAR